MSELRDPHRGTTRLKHLPVLPPNSSRWRTALAHWPREQVSHDLTQGCPHLPQQLPNLLRRKRTKSVCVCVCVRAHARARAHALWGLLSHYPPSSSGDPTFYPTFLGPSQLASSIPLAP